LKVERVEVFVVKVGQHDRFGGQVAAPKTLAGSNSISFSLNNCHLIDFVLNKTIFSRRGLQAFV
jgi:hypothetical protein